MCVCLCVGFLLLLFWGEFLLSNWYFTSCSQLLQSLAITVFGYNSVVRQALTSQYNCLQWRTEKAPCLVFAGLKFHTVGYDPCLVWFYVVVVVFSSFLYPHSISFASMFVLKFFLSFFFFFGGGKGLQDAMKYQSFAFRYTLFGFWAGYLVQRLYVRLVLNLSAVCLLL